MNESASLEQAAARVPSGAWAIGVSGGADSVALAALLRTQPLVRLHVVHLDHQARGEASAADAKFVRELSHQWNLPCTIATRDEIEPLLSDRPANPSARYRALRQALFRREIAAHRLQGVLLAHHADDQAETVLHRLCRGSGFAGLAGMSPDARVAGVRILRPLLQVRRDTLRRWLNAHQQPWRDDASNESNAYLRNRLRKLLRAHGELVDALLSLAASCRALRDWTRAAAPKLDEAFHAAQLAEAPSLLADEAARAWLRSRGIPSARISPATIASLVNMASDAASPSRQDFPGSLRVRRRGGRIFADQG